MRIRISSTEAVRSFGDCLGRIKHTGDVLVITKNNKAVAELIPISTSRRGTLADFLGAWIPDASDPSFADDLNRANSREIPETIPWAS